jgi:translation initiation factor 2 beta subunit (eIF-2beta)/eIF-5
LPQLTTRSSLDDVGVDIERDQVTLQSTGYQHLVGLNVEKCETNLVITHDTNTVLRRQLTDEQIVNNLSFGGGVFLRGEGAGSKPHTMCDGASDKA